jgi:hypothetical protein
MGFGRGQSRNFKLGGGVRLEGSDIYYREKNIRKIKYLNFYFFYKIIHIFKRFWKIEGTDPQPLWIRPWALDLLPPFGECLQCSVQWSCLIKSILMNLFSVGIFITSEYFFEYGIPQIILLDPELIHKFTPYIFPWPMTHAKELNYVCPLKISPWDPY